jgi:uncharacterized protein (UPF0335 family)
MTDTFTADEIVANAQASLDSINDRITRLRADKIRIGEQIRELLVERKPLLRIVSAAQGRQSHNGDTA